jgi:broad specificity phosphatase PhoE
VWKSDVAIESRVGEIPSPDGVALEDRGTWLREIMAGTWTQASERSGTHYVNYRDAIAACVASCKTDTVIFSHFVAINAVIGAAQGRDEVLIASLDNCSVTTFDITGGRLTVLEIGGEADTLIR